MRYRRKDKCAICGEDYIIDTEKRIGFCKCGLWTNLSLPSPEYLIKNGYEPCSEDWTIIFNTKDIH